MPELLRSHALNKNGRVHPLALSLLFIVAGVLIGKLWLIGVGVCIAAAVFINTSYRYRE